MVNNTKNQVHESYTRHSFQQKTTKAKVDYEEDLIKEEKKFQKKQLKERESKITS
jgi:hypothetical protein